MWRRYALATGAVSSQVDEDALPRAQLWLGRLLLVTGALRQVARGESHERFSLEQDELLRCLGAPPARDRKLRHAVLRARVVRRVEALEALEPDREAGVLRNVEVLGEALGLDRTERDVLTFGVLLQIYPVLRQVLMVAGIHSRRRLTEVLAAVLDAPLAAVVGATRPAEGLYAAGLLTDDSPMGIEDPILTLLLVPRAIVDAATGTPLDEARTFDLLAPLAPPATIALADVAHLGDDLRLVVGALSGARLARTRLNILLHGRPGTGKTELARVLAAAVGAHLHEVPCVDGEGDAMDGERRLAAYRVTQRLLARSSGAIVLFDEVEDAFPRVAHPLFGPITESARHKAYVNGLLEGASVPAIWIGNGVDQIDAAFLRRFDLVLEVRTPPAAARRRIVARHLDGLEITPELMDRISADRELTPADLERASRVVRLAGDVEDAGATLVRALAAGASPRASGAGARRLEGPRYDVGLVAASVDLEALAEGLAARGSATVLLEGDPGTGKTAWAEHLSARLSRPLLSRGASELLGAYVGQTEKAIAAAFAQAQAEHAILLLDEVDSLLQERARARHGWEVTAVNELLVRMERFDGILLCATNLASTLDRASLRRFDVKVRFEPPGPDGRFALFVATLEALGVPSPRGAARSRARARLDALRGLTPGDFAAATRRARLLPGPATVAHLLRHLEEELAARAGGPARPLGF